MKPNYQDEDEEETFNPYEPYDAWGMDHPEEGDDYDSDFNYDD